MHLEFLVEEPSVEAVLYNLIPKIVGTQVTFQPIRFQGKKDLLGKLFARLQGYASWLPEDYRIVVLVDKDRQNCYHLKAWLEEVARQAGLATKSKPNLASGFQVLNRIAVEELEAWFFGDVEALRQAYPRVPVTLANQSRYRDPDAIQGGTWEALERVLQRAGYFKSGLAKIQLARQVSVYMQPDRNRSKSFQVFRDGLRELLSY